MNSSTARRKAWLALLIAIIMAPCFLSAQTVTTLYSFNITDGALPCGRLIQATDGNLYGTTWGDYSYTNIGTVFKIGLDGTLETLHTFNGDDGSHPTAGVLQASDGHFYGTATRGGASGSGTIFRIASDGTFTTLRSFNGADGDWPQAGLIQASDGELYGTTQYGGLNYGTVFKISLDGTLVTLHTFGATDGAWPLSGVIQASDGNFYGTTNWGGGEAAGVGTIFRMSSNGTLVTLHTFINDTDGSGPAAELVQATDGNFYGTTAANYSTAAKNTVFRITSDRVFTPLHTFNGADGFMPQAPLVQASDGNFYGTTSKGGASDYGTVFKITPDGTFTVLHNFNGTDGRVPAGPLVRASDGKFYGTTLWGGAYDQGTIFRIDIDISETAAEQVADIVTLVNGLNLKQGIENSLDAKLQNAKAALTAANAGDRSNVCNLMASFINETLAQSGKALTADEAGQLIDAATRIRTVLACP